MALYCPRLCVGCVLDAPRTPTPATNGNANSNGIIQLFNYSVVVAL